MTERPERPEHPGEPLDRDFQRVHPLSPLLRVGVLLVAGLVASWRQLVEDPEPLVALAIMTTVVVVGTGYGVLSWWFTRFRIDAEELRIDSGVLLRRSRRIRIERLQGVTYEQVLTLYRDFLGSQAGELTIVGDFDEKACMPILKDTFSGWKAAKP